MMDASKKTQAVACGSGCLSTQPWCINDEVEILVFVRVCPSRTRVVLSSDLFLQRKVTTSNICLQK